MFTAGAIVGDIDLSNAKGVKAIRDVGKEAVNLKQTVGQGMEEAGGQGGKGFLKGLNAELGKKSMLGQITKLAIGGGAIAGVGMLTSKFAELGSMAAEMADGLRTGKISEREAMDEFAYGIPIIGGLARGIGGLEEAFTGEKAAAQLAAEAQKRHAEQAHQAYLETKRQTDALRELAIEMGKMKGHADADNQISSMSDGPGKKVSEVREAWNRRDESLQDDFNKKMKDQGLAPEDVQKKVAGIQFNMKYGNMGDPTLGSTQGDIDDLLKKVEEAQHSFHEAKSAIDKGFEKQLNDAKTDLLRQGMPTMGPQWDGMKPEATKSDAANSAFEKALDKLKPAITHQFERLPNPTVQAEELFGSKTVTGSNPGYVDVEKENSTITKENTEALKEATAAFRQGPMPGVSQSPPLAIQEIH